MPSLTRSLPARAAARAGEQLARWVAPGPKILVYHRVARLPTDPQLLCVSPEHFREHLAVLQGRCRVVSLAEVAAAVRGERPLPHRAVALTFDDGYADALMAAAPALESFGMPATVFVRTGFVGCEREFLSDELDRLLMQEGPLPEAVRLTLDGRTHEWRLGAGGSEKARFERERGWNVLQPAPGPRQEAYLEIKARLDPLPEAARQAALAELRAQVGAGAEGRPSHRALAGEEVGRLAAGGLVEVGAHTVTHPVLATLTPAEQQREVVESKQALEEWAGRPVLSFAYPYGSRNDYSEETVALVRGAGFALACTAATGRISRRTSVFELPRLPIRDMDGEAFARRLSEWE